jgi:hypothetical protein
MTVYAFGSLGHPFQRIPKLCGVGMPSPYAQSLLIEGIGQLHRNLRPHEREGSPFLRNPLIVRITQSSSNPTVVPSAGRTDAGE